MIEKIFDTFLGKGEAALNSLKKAKEIVRFFAFSIGQYFTPITDKLSRVWKVKSFHMAGILRRTRQIDPNSTHDCMDKSPVLRCCDDP